MTMICYDRLTYSLIEPMESLGVKFSDLELMTGLAEYRNGGLFVDFGVLTPRDPIARSITYQIGSELGRLHHSPVPLTSFLCLFVVTESDMSL
jgi:hypothetical protein